jgi:hypothetical protein
MSLTGNRTFVLAVGSLAGAFLLALLGKLTGDFSAVASIACASYAGKSAWTTGKGATPPIDIAPLPTGTVP